jgi:hypothetical protein
MGRSKAQGVTTAAAWLNVCPQRRTLTTSRNRRVHVADVFLLLVVVFVVVVACWMVVVLLLFLVDPVADPKKENDFRPTNDSDGDDGDDDEEEGVDHRDGRV